MTRHRLRLVRAFTRDELRELRGQVKTLPHDPACSTRRSALPGCDCPIRDVLHLIDDRIHWHETHQTG